MTLRRTTVFCLLRLLLAAVALWSSTRIFEPLLMEQRTWLATATVLLALGVLAWELRSRPRSRARRMARDAMAVLIVTGSLLATLHTLQQGGQLWWARSMILQSPPQAFRDLGQHIVVGYTDFEEVKYLAENGLIGGVYLGKRNVARRTPQQIRDEIETLQELRQDHGLPPLWVAADQEGGIVSHLSPPLPLLAPLSQLVQNATDASARSEAVFTFGALQGRQLANLGVNLNLAPVVDIDHGLVNPADRHSLISQRAISSDPTIVRDVAADFCAGLSQNNVHCTLKHFPGLGGVYADTHMESASLDTSITRLELKDWIPFTDLMHRPGIVTMVGHVKLTALDPVNPSSQSAAVVGMLRQQWKYDGVLITDDFCMGAVYASRTGIGEAAVKSLNAGMDLILISYDPAQYYPVMRALLKAQAEGRLKQGLLDTSARRLLQKWSMAE